MTTQPYSQAQNRLFRTVLRELDQLGYSGELLRENYRFHDYFAADDHVPTVTAPAAAFGQFPYDQNSACFAVLMSNGNGGAALIEKYRALGAPRAFEVKDDRVIHWRVSASPSISDKQQTIQADSIEEVFRKNVDAWKPSSVLRAKNFAEPGPRQLDFVDLGLFPALEEHIRQRLDHLLRSIASEAARDYESRTGREPNHERFYRLIFRALMAKVMHDKGLEPFASINEFSESSALLEKVALHYKDDQPIINDRVTQGKVIEGFWKSIDFSNLSVDVLAFIWENTFVTDEMRQGQGIHATPPNIARYILQRLPLDSVVASKGIIVEPCCGGGTFMVAALHKLRELLANVSAEERHSYFVKALYGFDTEERGLNIARSSLTLADFPNPNGWKLTNEDVFDLPTESPKFWSALKQASIVLCNPPFEDFSEDEQERYDFSFVQKPAEILSRVLERLPANGMLGFVLPHQALDGRAYRSLRTQIAARFKQLEIVHLPEGIFDRARFPSILLIAKQPSQDHQVVEVLFSRVLDKEKFLTIGEVAWSGSAAKTLDDISKSLGIAELGDLWDELSLHMTLEEAAVDIARGVEWEGFDREKHISEKALPGFVPGYHTSEEMYCFEPPPMVYLCAKKEIRRRNAWDKPWALPKVVCNAVRKSQVGPWKLCACSVNLNLVCSQNFTVIWPKLPWTPRALAAVMNGPVACAYVTTHERWKHLTKETFENVPIPSMTSKQIARLDGLVTEYEQLASIRRDFPDDSPLFGSKYPSAAKLAELLARIDYEVLMAYDLSVEAIKALASFFRGQDRPVPFAYQFISMFKKPPTRNKDDDAAEKKASWELLKKAIQEDRL